jgi:O-antigen/teichoic acid export membrane protein
MSVRKRILVNSVSNFISRFGINILSFFTLPLFIQHFGDSLYAVFILLNSVVESLIFFDFGVGTALGKKSSEYTINKDRDSYRIYFNWTFWFTSLFSGITGLVIFIFAPYWVRVLNIDESVYEIAITAFRIGSFYLTSYSILRIYQTILEGFEKFVIVNLFKIFQFVSLIVSACLILFAKLSFQTYLIISMLGNILPFVVYAYYFHSTTRIQVSGLPQFSTLWKSSFWQSSKDFFVIQVTSFLFSLADKFIISFIVGATQVVYYSVVTKIAFIIRMVNNQTLIVINPIIAKAKESKDKALIDKIIRQGGVYQFLLMLPLIVSAALFLKAFIRLWIGGAYTQYSHWGVLALVIYLLGPFSAMVQRVLIFGGYESKVKMVTIYLVLVNIAVSVILTYWIGMGGVIIGSIVQSLIAIPVFKKLAKDLLEVDYSLLTKDTIIATLIAALIVITFIASGLEHHIDSWAKFLFWGGVVFLLLVAYPAYRLFYKKDLFN